VLVSNCKVFSITKFKNGGKIIFFPGPHPCHKAALCAEHDFNENSVWNFGWSTLSKDATWRPIKGRIILKLVFGK
jgi:hypothetical protein